MSLPGVSHRSATVNGYLYKYLYAEPDSGSWLATVFLIHGWPDLSMGWRNQIPVLRELGFRVVCPDLIGFGGTDAPKPLELYSHKRASDDIRELARQLGSSTIILGGHDWGGSVVYRCALWHPDFVTHLFSVCTPFQPPTQKYYPLEEAVKIVPQFGYQQHLASTEVEQAVSSKYDIRQFLNGLYGGRTASKKPFLSPNHGVDLKLLGEVGKTPLLDDRMLDYYVEEYSRHGMHGTLNWYRTRGVNHVEELALLKQNPTSTISIPTLFIAANKDAVLLPSMSKGMECYIPQLTRAEVTAGHWALWEAKIEVNNILRDWVNNVVLKDLRKQTRNKL